MIGNGISFEIKVLNDILLIKEKLTGSWKSDIRKDAQMSPLHKLDVKIGIKLERFLFKLEQNR